MVNMKPVRTNVSEIVISKVLREDADFEISLFSETDFLIKRFKTIV